ncbi:MAG: hypothetical protein P4L40_03435 [Terracidiphilus sp.]|nr:hypothetical protein [Terracidiphilus sp.]
MLSPELAVIVLPPDVLCSHTHSAWPLYLSIGNHTASARDKPSGKSIITFINLPNKRATDQHEDYRYCFRMLYQSVWAAIFDVCNKWAGGFYLQFPGKDAPTLVIPRLGAIVGDIMELRNFYGISSTCAIRCNWIFGVGAASALPAGDDGTGAAAARPRAEPGEANSDDDEVALALALQVRVGEDSDIAEEDGGGGGAPVDDPPCDPEQFATRFMRPQVCKHKMFLVFCLVYYWH